MQINRYIVTTTTKQTDTNHTPPSTIRTREQRTIGGSRVTAATEPSPPLVIKPAGTGLAARTRSDAFHGVRRQLQGVIMCL